MVLWIAAFAFDRERLLEPTDQCRQGGISGTGFRSQRTRYAVWTLLPFDNSLPVPQKLLEATRIRNRDGFRNFCQRRARAGKYRHALRRRSGCDRQLGEECSI